MVRSLDDARRQSSTSRGRVPPHDLQAEESLLGAMLLSRDAIVEAVQVCTVEDFYKPAHGHVFEAVCSLYSQGEPADPVTVADELRRAGLLEAIGGVATLVSLQANTPATSNARRYAQIVEEHSLLRRLIGAASEIAELGYEVPDDVAAAVDRAESMVFEVAQRRVTTTTRPLRELLADQLDRLEALYERNEAITGIPTGFTDLDQMLAGLQPSNLIIIGARPSMGKTSLALGMAAHAAMDAQVPTLFFSLEMSHLEITQRLLCAEARVDASRMRTGRLHEQDWPKVAHAIGRLGEAPIYVDDNPNITVMDIRAKARRQKAREGLGLVVVDYLQLMSSRTKVENRQLEVSEISRNLKILARELEVPVIALSQLSRNLEARSDKRPVLADLRESGCMPAGTRLARADTGAQVTLGELVLTQEQPLVWSLDEQCRLTPRRLVRAFPSGVRPVFRLRLGSGYEVDATANHPFRTATGWTRLDHLQVGDAVAVPRRLPPPLHEQRWEDDEVVLLAHLVGAGSLGPVVSCSAPDGPSRAAVERAARRLFGIVVTASKAGSGWRLWLPSPYRVTQQRRHPVRNWLEPLGLWRLPAPSRFVPEEVFGLGDDQVRLFLRHLGATRASTVRRRSHDGEAGGTRFPSASRRLAHDVRLLLLRLGVESRVTGGKSGARQTWAVEVAGAEGVDDDGSFDEPPFDVMWDEVVEIVPAGTVPTFDATVEGTHNFVADGVVAHNSLEQDADVVMFIYRDEVYNTESTERGTAEILVTKHRNGPTGKTELAFLGQYTRFANMARL